jgi:Zn-dependent M16 (insulinase) family peptidase
MISLLNLRFKRQKAFLVLQFFLSRSVTESGTEVFDILSAMSEFLLRGENIRGVALNMTENHSSDFVKQTENFVSKLPRLVAENNSSSTSNLHEKNESQKTFVATAFPVHYTEWLCPRCGTRMKIACHFEF